MTLPGVSTPARAAQISARLMAATLMAARLMAARADRAALSPFPAQAPGFGFAVAYALGYR
jgi:hypothetical protein